MDVGGARKEGGPIAKIEQGYDLILAGAAAWRDTTRRVGSLVAQHAFNGN